MAYKINLKLMTQAYSCPHCHSVMQNFTKEDLAYETCTNCKGMWFDFGELKQALTWQNNSNFKSKTITRGDDRSDHDHQYNCIKCNTPLEEREYAYDSGIHIDGCTNCKGIFVSAEDLKLINQFLQSSKDSDEAREAHFKAQITLNQLAEDYQAKQESLSDELDKFYKLDDLFFIKAIKPIDKISEWLLGEMVDVDSFPIANRK